jgi:ATP-dependent DNA helicase RecQ
VPPYVIFHDSTLRAMAQSKPRSLPALAGLSGLGKAKLERYGQAFLEVILAHTEAPAEPEQAVAAIPAAPQDEDGTVEQTRALIFAGRSPEQVAEARALKLSTVLVHLAELVRRGDLTAAEATGLAEDELRAIEEAALALPEEERGRLKPIFERFGGRYSYGVLRCVSAGIAD